jgi:hypothetical protein
MTVNAPYAPWVLDYAGTLSLRRETKRFVKLTKALKWIDDTEKTLGFYDPEWSSDVKIAYDPQDDWDFDPDNLMGLISGRVVAKVIDGYAGGGAHYRLEIDQPAVRQAFWLGEGDFILFDRDDF